MTTEQKQEHLTPKAETSTGIIHSDSFALLAGILVGLLVIWLIPAKAQELEVYQPSSPVLVINIKKIVDADPTIMKAKAEADRAMEAYYAKPTCQGPYDLKHQRYREYMNKRDLLSQKIKAEAEKIAKQRGAKIVLPTTWVSWHDPTINITEQVGAALK